VHFAQLTQHHIVNQEALPRRCVCTRLCIVLLWRYDNIDTTATTSISFIRQIRTRFYTADTSLRRRSVALSRAAFRDGPLSIQYRFDKIYRVP